ncbi:MAG TPA: serine/threonine-protein kinase, partial [Propionibacteriaceae bacterium]|nr:serine/threonine-protein kinase [Propionibacteriaceae bacterium]
MRREQDVGGGVDVEHPHIRGLSEWKPIACGGVAVVWEARQLSLDRLVAVKVYQRELDERARRRFLSEAAAAGKLSDHPGIVSVYDAGVLPNDRPYLIMELCAGGSLTQWLNPDNQPSEEEVRRIGVRIADALAAAHASGVLHRDVEPASILIDSQGDPRLADFALAAVAGTEEAAEALPATPAYAAPEAFSTKPVTEAADVFSLAATLYAMLAGHPPRTVGVPPATFEEMVRLAERPIGPIPGVNGRLMDTLLAALSNDPSARPTAERFRDQLASLPTLSTSKQPPAGAADESAAMPPRSPVAGIAQSAVSTSQSVPTATAVDSPQAPDRAPFSPPHRRRNQVVRVAAAITIVIAIVAAGTAWLINEPASSRAPAAITQSAIPTTPSASNPPSPSSTE